MKPRSKEIIERGIWWADKTKVYFDSCYGTYPLVVDTLRRGCYRNIRDRERKHNGILVYDACRECHIVTAKLNNRELDLILGLTT